MIAILHPGPLGGSLWAPPSKSYSQRVLAAALLSSGPTEVLGVGQSDDEKVAKSLILAMGAEIREIHGDLWEIHPPSPRLRFPAGPYFFGESGLAARLFIPILSLGKGPYYVDGAPSLRARPMDPLIDSIQALGGGWTGEGPHLPFHFHGRLHLPAQITIDGKLSSQFLSGWLFAFAFSSPHPIRVEAPGLQSIPYVEMSLEILQKFGHPVQRISETTFQISPWRPEPGPRRISIEGDWSAAANFLVAAIIGRGAPLWIQGLPEFSLQADQAILDLAKDLGASPRFSGNGWQLTPGPSIKGFDVDARHCPDLFPILSILAAAAEGRSIIRGLARLKHKESDRATSISAMLTAFRVNHQLQDDQLIIHGGSKLQGARIQSFNDHRIVMAASIGALIAQGPTEIHGAESVAKSFPGFFDQLRRLGAQVQHINSTHS